MTGLLGTSTAAAQADVEAMRLDDERRTYAELEWAGKKAAGLLRSRGVGPGDRVALQLPNGLQFPAFYLGILGLGAIVVPMNPMLREAELSHQLRDSGAKLIIVGPESEPQALAAAAATGAGCMVVSDGPGDNVFAGVEPVVDFFDRLPDAPATILYTSGTTGTPKGAVLTHANLAAATDTVINLLDFDDQGVVLMTLPLFHIFGMTYMNAAFQVGATMSLVVPFDPGKVLEVIRRDRVTLFPAVPTMYTALLDHPDARDADWSSLRHCVSGGASLPVEVLRELEATFGATLLEGYGLSESTGTATVNPPDGIRKPGSIGVPVPGVRLRVVDDGGRDVPPGEKGEILLLGPVVMTGYWDRPEATSAALDGGWLHTGDVGRVDGDGYVYIVDRKKDLIIRGGYNVYPREVEEVFYGHPDVREVAVVGRPDPRLGEEVVAAVVLREGAEVTEEQLREHVKTRVAAYKYPRVVRIVPELPKGATGKILKRAVKLRSDA
ncbi:MAG: long-chain-fatty-acid--CoA ligase [Solirubrobacterales bacterium]